MTASGEVVRDLFAQLTAVYRDYETAAIDGARWQVGRDEWLTLRPAFGDDLPDPALDDRLLALPIDVIGGSQPITLIPGPLGKRGAAAALGNARKLPGEHQ